MINFSLKGSPQHRLNHNNNKSGGNPLYNPIIYCDFNDLFNLIYPDHHQLNYVKLAQQNFRSILDLLSRSSDTLLDVFENTVLVRQIELYKHVYTQVLSCEADSASLSPAEQYLKLIITLSHAYHQHECIKVCYLNQQHQIICFDTLYVGTTNHVPIDEMEILQRAQHLQSNAIIIVHNHPQGDVQPSLEDISVSYKLRQFLKQHAIDLLQSYVYCHGQLRAILK